MVVVIVVVVVSPVIGFLFYLFIYFVCVGLFVRCYRGMSHYVDDECEVEGGDNAEELVFWETSQDRDFINDCSQESTGFSHRVFDFQNALGQFVVFYCLFYFFFFAASLDVDQSTEREIDVGTDDGQLRTDAGSSQSIPRCGAASQVRSLMSLCNRGSALCSKLITLTTTALGGSSWIVEFGVR